MAENKTKATNVSAEAFIDAVPNPTRRADAKTLSALMARVSGEPATMWGPTIVGFGVRHYRYESGREGEICRIGFSPRAGNLVLYIAGAPQELYARLGKHKRGAGCLYLNKLADIDAEVLEAMIAASWDGDGYQRAAG